MAEKGLLAIGKIQKVHGIRGELKVFSFSGSTELLYSVDEIHIGKDKREAEPFKIRKVRGRGKTAIVEIDGMDLQRARERVGHYLWVPRERLPLLGEDEYYWVDLIGMEVYSKNGRPLGVIEGITNFGSSDIYFCNDGRREILIPAIKGLIERVDIEGRRIIIEEVEGLI